MENRAASDDSVTPKASFRAGFRIGPARLFGKQTIGDGAAGPLLVRWILFRCEAWGVYLHKFCRSDHDRALHDHPWPFVSIILKGGYDECHDQTIDGSETVVCHRAGNVVIRPAEWRHRVIIPEGNGPSWNLILVGRRVRAWGFFTKQGWCWWRKYNPDTAICEDGILFTGGKD